MNVEAVKKLLIDEVAKAGSYRSLSQSWGIDKSYISLVVTGKSRPGPKILRQLGLRAVVKRSYERIK